jgi:hypothetical protein
MGQTLTCPIVTLHRDAFDLITKSMNRQTYLALACTCRNIDKIYKDNYKKRTLTFVCDSQFRKYLTPELIKALEHSMSQKTGWRRLKVTLKIDFQDSYKHPINALCLGKELNLPEGLDSANLNALMMCSSNKSSVFESNLPFFDQFSNLKSLMLCCFTFNDNVLSMFSKFPLLEFLCLNLCIIPKINDVSKIFEYCTALKEIWLIDDLSPDEAPLKLHPQLERFKVVTSSTFEVNASQCTQLKHLAIKSFYPKITLPKVECVHTLSVDGYLKNPECLIHSFITVKKLIIHWDPIRQKKTLGSSSSDQGYEKRLDYSLLTSLEKVNVIEPSTEHTLYFTFAKGTGEIHVKLIWLKTDNPITVVRTFKRSRKAPIKVSVRLSKTKANS